MELLIAESWRLYHAAEPMACVVKPSIPILFFGDRARYVPSSLKVITVGLNPSRAEFPHDDPFMRFRPAQHVYPAILDGQFAGDYLAALHAYFRDTPYSGWFNTFEPLLNGMESSYYDGRLNTALHTDLCSPLATNPTWSGLTTERTELAVDGVPLWLRLARYLAPDIILISVARQYLGVLDFPVLGAWETLFTVERANPYRIEAREVEVLPGKRTLLVFGLASQKPFGKVSDADKRTIGRCIREYVRGR